MSHIVDCATGAEGPGHERRGRLVEESERKGQLGRRPGQRHHRAGSAHPACGWSRRALRPASSRARRHRYGRSPTITGPTRSSGSLRRDRARDLCAGSAQALEAGTARAMMNLTTLANGLRVASRPMPGVETVAVGLYADDGLAARSRRVSTASRICSSIWCSRAPAAARRARSAKRSRMSAATSTPATDREPTAFHRSAAGRRSARSASSCSPTWSAGRISTTTHLEREKKVVLQELGEAPRHGLDDLVFDHLSEAAFAEQPLGRSVLGDEDEHPRRSRVDDLHAWLDAPVSARPAGPRRRRQGRPRAHSSRSPSGCSATWPTAACRRIAPAHFTGGSALRPAQERSGASCACRACAGLAARPDAYALALFADVVGGGTSSRLFQQLREERGLAYSVCCRGADLHADTGLFCDLLSRRPRRAPRRWRSR